MSKRIASLLALVLVLLLPMAVDASSCDEKCTPPIGKEKLKAFVKIDAKSGRVLEGQTRFPADTQIQVVIANQNPFKYTYRYEIEEREIETAVILDALQRLGLPLLESEKDSDVEQLTDSSRASDPGAATECQAMQAEFEKASESQNQLLAAARAVQDSVAGQKGHINALNAFTKSIDTLPDDVQGCKDLCAEGVQVLPKLDAFLQRGDKKALDAFLKAQLAVSKATDALEIQVENRLPSLASDQERQDCTNRLASYKNKARGLLALAVASQKTFEKDITEIDALAKDVKAMRDVVKEVLDSDESFISFMYVAYLEARPEPTEFKITILRKERGKKEEKKVTVTIRAGRSRFSISAGIGLSFVEQQTFGRQQALVPTTTTMEDGSVVMGTGLGEIFAVTQRSSEALVGVFQLNGLIRSGRRVSWGWALGATVGEGEGESSNLGYFTGPTLALIGDQLFFTFAYHQREVSELGGSFKVGDPIPEGFMGDLPLTTDDKGGLLLTVTYRFK